MSTYEETYKEMGKRLRKEREKMGFTQKKMGSRLNVGHYCVSRYENGELPPLDILISYSHIFNCSIDYLVLGNKGHLPFSKLEKYMLGMNDKEKMKFLNDIAGILDSFSLLITRKKDRDLQ